MRHAPQARQIRAARALLDWSQNTLAERAGVSVLTIKRLEDEAVGASEASRAAVVRALEEGGIAFLGPGDSVPDDASGVSLTAR